MTFLQGLQRNGIAPRWAALIAGLAYLTNPVAYAEFYAYPKLVVAHDIGRTIANINAHGTMFAAMITCYLLNFVVCDIVMAWALYLLLVPVNRALSMLAAWFQLVYAAMGLVAVYNLVSVLHLLRIPEYQEVFGPAQLQAQVLLAPSGLPSAVRLCSGSVWRSPHPDRVSRRSLSLHPENPRNHFGHHWLRLHPQHPGSLLPVVRRLRLDVCDLLWRDPVHDLAPGPGLEDSRSR